MSQFDRDFSTTVPDLQAEYGEPIEYWVGGTTKLNISAIPNSMGLTERGQDGNRTRGIELMILVNHSDVPNPETNVDFVVVPGHWVQSKKPTVELRVAKINPDESSETMFSLSLGQKRR